ncbi:hypothetical protein [Amycolatopsis panacis]|uniref:hypothetical protein n=1 Tax=Amycolatopsis panacis TaxID=2340917 RepID=UPI0013142E0D|nr:hypothetical protein [Amycolatopsis panacis]
MSDLPPVGPPGSSPVPRNAGFVNFARLPRQDEVSQPEIAASHAAYDLVSLMSWGKSA